MQLGFKSCQLTPRPGVDVTTAESTWIKFSIGCSLRWPCCCPSEGRFLKVRTTTCNLFGRSECTRVRPPRCRKSVWSLFCLIVNRASPMFAVQLWTRRGNEALATCRRPLKQENVPHVCPRSRCFLRCRRAQPAGAPSDGINCLCRHKCEFTRPQVKAVHCLCLTLSW